MDDKTMKTASFIFAMIATGTGLGAAVYWWRSSALKVETPSFSARDKESPKNYLCIMSADLNRRFARF